MAFKIARLARWIATRERMMIDWVRVARAACSPGGAGWRMGGCPGPRPRWPACPAQRTAATATRSSATFGFRQLSDLARALEKDAAHLDHDELVRQVGRISAAFGDAETNARRTLQTLPTAAA